MMSRHFAPSRVEWAGGERLSTRLLRNHLTSFNGVLKRVTCRIQQRWTVWWWKMLNLFGQGLILILLFCVYRIEKWSASKTNLESLISGCWGFHKPGKVLQWVYLFSVRTDNWSFFLFVSFLLIKDRVIHWEYADKPWRRRGSNKSFFWRASVQRRRKSKLKLPIPVNQTTI